MHPHSLSAPVLIRRPGVANVSPLKRYFAYCLLFSLALLWIFPIATNDGPVHMGFANFMLTGDSGDFASELYVLNDGIYPNLIVYELLVILLRLLSPGAAESVVQLICLLGPSLAAFFAISQIRKDRAWLAILILPLSLHQAFFLGLYNFCFSTIAFFIAIGSFYWMQKKVSPWSLLAPIAALYAAFFCHAGGFIAALISLGMLTLVSGVGRLMDGHRLVSALRSQVRNLAVFASQLPLGVIILIGGSKGPTIYGVPLLVRIANMLRLRLVETHFPSEAYVGALLNLAFGTGVAWIIWKLYEGRLRHGGSVRREAAGMVAVVAALCMLALFFPDVMGGGWTHFLRMCLFPFLAVPLCLAYLPAKPVTDITLETIGVLSVIILLSNTVYVQSEIKKELVYFSDIDRLIGKHCSIMPIVTEKGPPHLNEMRYSPFFHVATRLEMTGDRVALFNFLARLDVYPVRYRSGRDPQALIYEWKPDQRSTQIWHVNVKRFKDMTGMPVDYILLWGAAASAPPSLEKKLSTLLITSKEVYRSPDARVRLYKLASDGNSRCTSH